VIEKSLARPGRTRSTREERGIAIFDERGDEIEHVKGWTWLVPSCSGDVLYGVDLKSESCECPDFEGRGLPCEHVYAARIARSKCGECSGCRRKVRFRDLHEVGDDNLTFFEGDAVCERCAMDHGVL
jgi:hypothetical protein